MADENVALPDEEINLDGSIAPSSNQDAAPPVQFKMENRAPSLAKQILPDASDADVLDNILSVPAETLIPWEKCMLPSRGMYYGWADGIVSVRAMTIQTEKHLANDRLAKSGQAIDMMLQDCCVLPNNMSWNDLLVGDHAYILYFIRGITYGPNYEFMVKCPKCGKSNLTNYNLNELNSTTKFADPSLGQEPYRIDLPYLSRVTGRQVYVHVRFMRRGDLNNMIKKQKIKIAQARSVRMSDANQVDDSPMLADEVINENLDQIVVSVNGNHDRRKIEALFNDKLHMEDVGVIRDWMNKNTPGISPVIEIQCPSCQAVSRTLLPLTDSFFRVVQQRGDGE